MIAPEVHRNERLRCKHRTVLAVGGVTDSTVGHELYFVGFLDLFEKPVFCDTHASCDSTELTHSVFEAVGDHGCILGTVQLV